MYIRIYLVVRVAFHRLWILVGRFLGSQRIVVFAIIRHFTPSLYPFVRTLLSTKLIIISRMLHLSLISLPISAIASAVPWHVRPATFDAPPSPSSVWPSHPLWLLSMIMTSSGTTLAQTLTLTTRTETSSNSILIPVLLSPNLKLHDLYKVSTMRMSQWLMNPDRGLLWKLTVCLLVHHPPVLIIHFESKEPVSQRASDVFSSTQDVHPIAEIPRLPSQNPSIKL